MDLVQNVGLFGTKTRSSTLLLINMMGETHASEMAKILGKSLSRIQAALYSLEQAGVVVGAEEGNTRRVRLNPRYIARSELEKLLSRLASHEVELQQRIAAARRRPRRLGKAL